MGAEDITQDKTGWKPYWQIGPVKFDFVGHTATAFLKNKDTALQQNHLFFHMLRTVQHHPAVSTGLCFKRFPILLTAENLPYRYIEKQLHSVGWLLPGST